MKLYNSLSRTIEDFKPIDQKSVTMYVCGITPYDTTHLGHAFTYIFFDVLIRLLNHNGYKITYTQNVTDINDRDNDILKRAKEQATTWENLSKFWTEKFLADMQTLNWIKPDNFLFASENVPSMIRIIEKLLKNGFAYQRNRGMYLDISKKKDYGKLSGFDQEKMLKVAKEFEEDLDNPDKKNQLDITLWRPSKADQSQHIPSFGSPFGPGRPGWHLECSAMAIDSLGEQIDIHGGGQDLIYPHHEAEIAQSEGATGKIPFAKYWLHTGTVGYKGQKMSKSLGNLVMVSELLKKYSPNAIRYMLLSKHYRESWEYFEKDLIEAEKKITKIKHTLTSVIPDQIGDPWIPAFAGMTKNNLLNEFNTALDENMNTPKALEIMLNVENGEEAKQMAEILGFVVSY